MKLIELTHVVSNGQTQVVLLDPNTFNYMENTASGYGSIVYYGTGCIDVTESPKKITELINKMNKQELSKIIKQLKSIGIDGETMEYIINGVGMQEQILRQLVLGAYDDTIKQLLEEKKTLK